LNSVRFLRETATKTEACDYVAFAIAHGRFDDPGAVLDHEEPLPPSGTGRRVASGPMSAWSALRTQLRNRARSEKCQSRFVSDLRSMTSARPQQADVLSSGRYVSKVSISDVNVFYSITSSARPSSVGGTVSPSLFAVLRLTASSKRIGCSTGSSLGRTPLIILAT
jgi:hypothetical protein